MITAALVGNPNVGKTTLFNALTGSNQYVGNWAGVTVEKKEGYIEKDVKIVDLPGIYAMDTYSNEEKVSKKFIIEEKPDVIINIADAANLNRNLYLTTQLKEFNIPIILLLNMIDVANEKGIIIDCDKLSEKLNVRVVPISAAKGMGIDKVASMLKEGNYYAHKQEDYYKQTDENQTYQYIDGILKDVIKTSKSKGLGITEKLDGIVLNKYVAYPIFLLIMFLIFQLTFNWVGQPVADILSGLLDDKLIPFLRESMSGMSPWFSSLIVDGIVSGVGSVIVFLPVILTLFLGICLLEDSGYMARAAFIMDKLMRKMGLSGKAFIPLIVGFGCSVPGIMSSRTLESEKDRKLTALLVPLMSCNAKLPVYGLFAAVFFKEKGTLVIFSLYLLGVVMALVMGILFKNTIFKKDEEPFLIELPEYKCPELKNLIDHTWEKGKGFLKKAGTVIFSMSVLVWFLSNFNMSGMTQIDESFLASIGKAITPIFKPLGFGNWQNSVSLLTGLMAKEVVVGTMGVIYGGNLQTVLMQHFNTLTAISFLVFVLLYTPCISVIAAMKKEYGTKMAVFSVVYQVVLAWSMSFVVYKLGVLLLNVM